VDYSLNSNLIHIALSQATCKNEVGRLYRHDQQLTTWLMGTEKTDLSSVPMASSHYAEANTLFLQIKTIR
jgi:hypothetical protein